MKFFSIKENCPNKSTLGVSSLNRLQLIQKFCCDCNVIIKQPFPILTTYEQKDGFSIQIKKKKTVRP